MRYNKRRIGIMKNTIKKANMCGQFIDMQPTRGGIPARLVSCLLRRCDIERIGVPFVTGRVRWLRIGRRLRPDDRIFHHYTDTEKVERYTWCLRQIEYAKHIKGKRPADDASYFKWYTEKYNFRYPKSAQKVVKEILECSIV